MIKTKTLTCIDYLYTLIYLSMNSGCQAVSDDALQGICNTQQQCTDIGGSADGNCAAGFGVCCIVV